MSTSEKDEKQKGVRARVRAAVGLANATNAWQIASSRMDGGLSHDQPGLETRSDAAAQPAAEDRSLNHVQRGASASEQPSGTHAGVPSAATSAVDTETDDAPRPVQGGAHVYQSLRHILRAAAAFKLPFSNILHEKSLCKDRARR